MPRRRELQGIAGNLAQWCRSRNFDNEGYWAMGQLYAFAESIRTNELVLNVLEQTLLPAPEAEQFASAFRRISTVVQRELEAKNIPRWWIREMYIVFKFNAVYQQKYHDPLSSFGEPCVWTVSIKTDLGTVYHKEAGCNVWVHHPQRERCRYGF